MRPKLLGAFLSVILLANCGLLEDPSTRVVLITVDTLRYDSFGKDMPELAALAEEQGVVFTRFYTSTATTQPSHASMFTGLHPWQHGVHRNGQNLDEARVTVAEVLQEAGFSTAAVVASYPVSQDFGFGQGFDIYDDDFENGRLGLWARYEDQREETEKFHSPADTIGQKAKDLVEQAEEDVDKFLWLHYFDPHDPYGDSTDKRWAGPVEVLTMAEQGKDTSRALQRARRLYDADVGFLDKHMTALIRELLADRSYSTHVLIVADHGESFGEDGSMGHGTRLTAGQIHVPCIIFSPGLGPAVRTDAAGSIDVAATLLAMAGDETKLGFGRNLLVEPDEAPRVFGMRRVYGPGTTFARLDGERYPVDGRLFYAVVRDEIVRGNADGIENPPQSVSEEQRQDLTKQLQQLFSVFTEEAEGTFKQEELTSEARKALEALGYIQ